jgi:hypothetical protein
MFACHSSRFASVRRSGAPAAVLVAGPALLAPGLLRLRPAR